MKKTALKTTLIFSCILSFTASAYSSDSAGQFNSDEWQSSPTAWYIEWKRIRKYTRVAVSTHQEAVFPQFISQTRQLYLNAWKWADGDAKNYCVTAASQLLKGLEKLEGGSPSGMELTQASDSYGDRCIAAIRGR